MNSDVEASENTLLINTKEVKNNTENNQKTSLFKYLTIFILLSLATYIAFNLKIINNGFIKTTNLKREKHLLMKKDLNSVKSDVRSEALKTDPEDQEESPLADEFRMMSLVGATPDSNFNVCQSKYKHGDYLNVQVKPGCISLFNNDVSVQQLSSFITFCGCETLGPKKYDFVALQNAGLISKDGAGLISYIATGDGASVTLYNSAEFESEDKIVIGPNTKTPASRIVRGEGTWDNEIYSIILQSWSSCNLPPVACAPVTTQAPVTAPTPNPFIQPTANPTKQPIINPTPSPSAVPSFIPTLKPRARPTMEPLANPTEYPTMEPTLNPTPVPTLEPTDYPVAEPSQIPTEAPINHDPTLEPTQAPTMDPRILICKGKSAAESKIIPGKTFPKEGCASFFWSNMDSIQKSYVSTICSCGEVGQLTIPNEMMAKIGAARSDGFPTVSSIIMGNKTSITIYSTDDNTGIDKYVLGPGEIADLTKLQRPSGGGPWNDRVRSLQVMAWSECKQHEFKNDCIDF